MRRARRRVKDLFGDMSDEPGTSTPLHTFSSCPLSPSDTHEPVYIFPSMPLVENDNLQRVFVFLSALKTKHGLSETALDGVIRLLKLFGRLEFEFSTYATFKRRVSDSVGLTVEDGVARISVEAFLQRKFFCDADWAHKVSNPTQPLHLDWGDAVVQETQTLYISLSTDGVSSAKMNGTQLWPILVCILNLPLSERGRSHELFTTAISKKKPENFNSFFSPLVDELSRLEKGFTVFNSATNSQEVWKLRWRFTVLDNDGHSRVLLKIATSGYWGCGWCKDKGEYLNGSVRHINCGTIRTAANTEPGKDGIFEVSVMSQLSHKDWWRGHPIDCMHTVLLRIGEHLVSHTVDKKKLAGLNSLQWPSNVSWRPRTTNDWKAESYKLFAFVAPFVLWISNAPNDVLKLWGAYSCLVRLLFTLCMRTTSLTEYALTVRDSVDTFLRHYNHVVGKDRTTYTVHILEHLPDCILELGPPYSFSAFPFEGYYSLYRRNINGKKHVLEDVAFTSILSWMTPLMALKLPRDERFDEDLEILTNLDLGVVCGTQEEVFVGDTEGGECTFSGRTISRTSDMELQEALNVLWELQETFTVQQYRVVQFQGLTARNDGKRAYFLQRGDVRWFVIIDSLFSAKMRGELDDFGYIYGRLWKVVGEMDECKTVYIGENMGKRAMPISCLKGYAVIHVLSSSKMIKTKGISKRLSRGMVVGTVLMESMVANVDEEE